jgi:hypothetical protein
MSNYGWSISKNRVKFQVHLSSRQTNSWTGESKYNAIYQTNFRGHLDTSDFQKEYNVYVSFQSEMTSDFTAAGIDPTNSYAIHMDIGPNIINAAAFRERQTPMMIAYQSQFTNGANVYTRFDVGHTDNCPIRVKSLYNVDTIEFEVFDINGQTIIPNTGPDYQVILSFEEVAF